MSDDLDIQKEVMRAEAKRARSKLCLTPDDETALCCNFFSHINLEKGACVASYWPIKREIDTHILMEEIVERGIHVALPVAEKDSRILKFAKWDLKSDVEQGLYNICHPVIDDNTEWLEPDVFLVPLLAFDRQGYRLGYGGGYYDSTIALYRSEKDIVAVGLGYAQQACLFNLPKEEHDERMDWIITEQNATSF